jgi:hypothetical protein
MILLNCIKIRWDNNNVIGTEENSDIIARVVPWGLSIIYEK